VRRWRRQYEASAEGAAATPAMAELAGWLLANLPPAAPRASVIHGDYRCGVQRCKSRESSVGSFGREMSSRGRFATPADLPFRDAGPDRQRKCGTIRNLHIAAWCGGARLDNLVFALHEPKVIGVLDWELSTLGDPLADAAYSCLVYHMPPGLPILDAFNPNELPAGVPTEAQYVQQYCHR
jgi:aminoglycoside phosphotransferase (APT) family kinase protein